MSTKGTALAQPIKIGPRTAKNRFVIQPMECGDAINGGHLSPRAIERYEKLMEGDAGVIDFESITMQYDSRARTNQIALYPNDPEDIKEWGKFIKHLKDINPDPLLIVQLNHSGEISGGGDKIRYSVKPLYRYEGIEVTDEYADDVIKTMVETSKILYDLGADGVDLKFCHGYFGSQVLRPYNDRNWKYGGSWANRSRYAFDMVEKARKAVPDENFLIGSKVSMWEGFPGGQGTAGPDSPIIDLTESIDLCKGIVERGASYILESTGAPTHTMELHMPWRDKPDDVYIHMSMAKYIKDACPDTVVMGGAYSVLNKGKNKLNAIYPEKNGLIYFGNYNIEHGNCDMIALGRQSLADPYLPKKYCDDKVEDIKWCVACDCCVELLIQQENVGCVVHNKPYTEVLKNCRATKGPLLRKNTD
ncbi:MAG: 2,4-dienoyl-CoA reductase [Christensenellaceae bacterium]|nr:2,4-dienoyl-CoA reductase [Christensenellaceae bacterium]